jgi:hypothetical protein
MSLWTNESRKVDNEDNAHFNRFIFTNASFPIGNKPLPNARSHTFTSPRCTHWVADVNTSEYTLSESDGRRMIAAILARFLQKSCLSRWQRDSSAPLGGPSTGRSFDECIDRIFTDQ